MEKKKISYYGRVLLIAAEVFLIGFLDYAVAHYLPFEMGHYISLNVLYCLPIIQTARLTAIHAKRRYDTHTSSFYRDGSGTFLERDRGGHFLAVFSQDCFRIKYVYP